MGLDQGGLLQAPGVRTALATALFRDGELSLARAARGRRDGHGAFISHLSPRLAIPGDPSDGSRKPTPTFDTLDAMVQSSSVTPAL